MNHIIHNYEFKIFLGLTIIAMSNAQNLGRYALYEEVAERLRQRIFTRELIPGSWIDEMKISQEYGISRTPLREALKVLATEGLVTMKMRRGAYVTEVSDKDLNDVYHLLSLLESDAAAQVAQRARPEDLEELQNLHRQLEQAVPNRAAFFEINERFHMRLLEMGQNKWRTQMVIDLRKVMKLNRQNSLLKSGRVEESFLEHQTLMQALAARNPTMSMQAMQAHFANGLEAASPDAFVPQSTPPQMGLAAAVG
jgi:DNA-binding GntR family transcriptional regulator